MFDFISRQTAWHTERTAQLINASDTINKDLPAHKQSTRYKRKKFVESIHEYYDKKEIKALQRMPATEVPVCAGDVHRLLTGGPGTGYFYIQYQARGTEEAYQDYTEGYRRKGIVP